MGCSSDIITLNSVNADGVSGAIVMEGHGDNEHCFVDVGKQCQYGVEIEIINMTLETGYFGYDYADTDGYSEEWGQWDICYDSVFFAHMSNGQQQQTEQQCGCTGNDDCIHKSPPTKYDKDDEYNYMPLDQTVKPTNYVFSGDQVKMVVYSDSIVSGGSIAIDWKCRDLTQEGICPSTKCYTQSEAWEPGKDVSCKMTNPDCLNVSCSSNSIKATFDAELFHTNHENAGFFTEQLKWGHREMWYNGNKLELNAPCGYTLIDGGIQIDWAYDQCNVTPTMNENDEIVYSVSLISPGNAPGYETIEFYVDTAVETSCAYDSKVVVQSGIWINQEDVEAAENAKGKLDSTFACNFYEDEARTKQILGHNIVNMGEMIYGQVTSEKLTGISYELVGVTVSNANNPAMSFAVIDGGKPKRRVKATSEGSAMTGQSVAFSYLSFGFESHTGSNQNEINIECAVDLFVNIETTTTTTTTTSSTTTFSEWETNHPYNPCWHDMDAVCVTQCDDNGNCYYVNIADQLPGK